MTQLNQDGRSDTERPSFQEQLLKNVPHIRAYARSLTGSREDGEDLLQDTVVRAMKYQEQFIAGTSMRAWLFTIARNKFLSDRRRSWRQLPWDQALAERTLTTDMEMSEVEATIELNRLLLCIACLSQDRADAIIAVGYLGLSYEESAWILGVAVGTLKSRVSRARTELLNLLENAEELEKVNTSVFRTLTQGIPKSDPYFPIAKAYEDLYALNGSTLKVETAQGMVLSEEDAAWNELVASGALDTNDTGLDELY